MFDLSTTGQESSHDGGGGGMRGSGVGSSSMLGYSVSSPQLKRRRSQTGEVDEEERRLSNGTPTGEEAARAHVTLLEERMRMEKEEALKRGGRGWDVINNRKKKVWEREPVPMQEKEEWIAR